MRLKRLFSGVLASLLATTLVMTDVAGGVTAASANSESQGVVLNGLVADDDPGRLGTKTVIMSSAAPTTVSYRLVPQYTQSYAAGVKVRLYLPSLKYVDGKYEVTTRDEAPTAMGVQGEVRSGGGWIVHTPGKVKGGYIELEYEGNLASGSNPAFELVLSTYNDGSTGPYGGIPEGFQFSINGFVSYEQFGGDESKAWSTPGLFDEESKITVIASDLKWEPAISAFAPGGGSTAVPMWDRFQYFDYVYKLQNTSTNPASNIEAYSVNLQLQTTENINGIIPTDINRWTFTGHGNQPTMNDNADYAEGQFIGVPGEGGVLIYDVTDVYQTPGWDGATGLGDPIPYSYDGAGMVTIDRTHGDARDKVTPGTERVYLVKLPMSRQGFPNLPTTYKVDAITNIILGEDTNWSKTKTALREVLTPSYDFDFKHTPEKSESVYGLSTYTQITDMKNTSNVPVFTPSIEYTTVTNFRHSDIVYLIDAADAERFKDVTLSYTYTVKTGNTTAERKVSVKPTFVADPDNDGKMKAVFDVSAVNDAESWNGKFNFTNLDDRLEPGEVIPLTIQFHGVPMEVKTMTFPAVTTYVEKFASNEDYTAPTTYTEVPHTVQRDATFKVLMPNEVYPRDAVRIDGSSTNSQSYKTVEWNKETTLGFSFGTNDETAHTSKHTITVNTSTAAPIKDARMVIKPELFAAGEIKSITVVDVDGKETVIDLEGRDLTQAFTVELANGFSKIVVETGEFLTDGARNFIDVIGTIDNGLKTTHTVKVESETYQGEPYNKTNKDSATGYIAIQLPGELSVLTGVRVDGSSTSSPSPKVVQWEAESVLAFSFGTNNITSETTETTITVNTATKEAVKDATMVIRPNLFTDAQDVSIKVVLLDGTEQVIDLTGMDLAQALEIPLPDKFGKIVVETGTFKSNGAVNYIDVVGTVSNGLTTSHTVNVAMKGYQGVPFNANRTSSSTGYLTIQLPADQAPNVSIVGIYGERRTDSPTTIPYEAPVSAEYRLTTGGVNAPEWTYTITKDEPSKMPVEPTESKGILVDGKLTVSAALLAAASDVVVTFTDDKGETQSFPIDADNAVIDYSAITLKGEIVKIVVSGTNLKLSSYTPVVTIDYDSQIDMGQNQRVRATYEGTPNAPYVSNKTASSSHLFEVLNTYTTTSIEGVNQITKGQGAGNSYDEWVRQTRTTGTCSGCYMWDYNLDQGYKSLGGFASSIHRPSKLTRKDEYSPWVTNVNANNDQTTVIDVTLPYQQFDTYYVKIREDLRDFIQDVKLYRMVDGQEVLWKTVPGTDWVNNTAERNQWRINTAHQGVDGAALFETKASTTDADHPYYKHPFADNVAPDQPLSRVSVTLKFERTDLASPPQLPGTTSRVIEYMGRFFETSEEGKRATTSVSKDTFGKRFPITRNHTATPVYSIVHYPYAQTETGAQKDVKTQREVVTMGTEGNYLASIWNVADQDWAYHAPHGPDIYVPIHTDADEWMKKYEPESFHDQLAYEFTYPATPDVDGVYNLDPTKIVFENDSLKYLTALRIDTAEVGHQAVSFTDAERAAFIAAGKLVVTYDNSLAPGFHKISDSEYKVSLGEGVYPVSFEATYNEINGLGDNTAELQGVTPDSLGSNKSTSVSGLNEIHVRIGGIVNGNKDLVGTTKIYREPNDSDRKLMNTSTGVLAGYTPKLGATVDMAFDKTKMHDYGEDGITPNLLTMDAGMRNSSEADISSFQLTVNTDAYFRSQKLEIPATVFDGVAGDWKTTAVTLGTPNGDVSVPLGRFDLVDGMYVLNIDALYEGADKLIDSKIITVETGGTSKLEVREITKVTIDFAAAKPGVVMWGSRSIADQRAIEDEAGTPEADRKVMLQRMIEGSYFFITGDYVDEAVAADGVEPWTGERKGWDSKPAMRTDGAFVNSSTYRTGSWTTSATDLTTPLSIYQPAATSGNVGINPKLTYSKYGDAPSVYHRTVNMQFRGAQLDNSLQLTTKDFPYDADSNAQVATTDMVVGDTTRVLYEIRNSAAEDAENRNAMFDPSAYFTAPTGMNITGIQVVTPGSVTALHNVIAELERTNKPLTADQYTINDTATPSKSRSVQFSTTLEAQESVWIFVQYEAVNDFDESNLEAPMGKGVTIKAYATTGYQHHIQNFNQGAHAQYGMNVLTNGSTDNTFTADHNGDGHAERSVGLYSTYRYANTSPLSIKSSFDVESLSGTPVTITVGNQVNHIGHHNTDMVVEIDLDTRANGFELTEIPVPVHLDGLTKPVVYGLIGDEWVVLVDGEHDLSKVTAIRVEYGIVPGFTEDRSSFEIPEFEIHGIGHWQNYSGDSTKNSVIRSTAQMTLTHRDGSQDENPEVDRYRTTISEDSLTIYKGLHEVELNLQSFDTEDEALVEYSDAQASKVGKTSYLPGETIWNKISVRNENAPASANTGRGKAPVLDPVIYDKVPEYMTAELMGKFVSEDGTVDVAGAVAAGLLVIKHFDKDGAVIDGAKLPEVKVTDIKGLDIAGAQQFANDLHNNRHGKLSSAEPINTSVNPAEEIDFKLFTYTFEQDLGRGERFEVMYPAKIRTKDLPYATYPDGRAVWAPLLGWYASNDVVSSNAHTYDMDMAALLHDAGFSGARSHEMTAGEFLSESTSWMPGENRTRLQPESNTTRIDTYYDATANSQKSHAVYMGEYASNELRVSGSVDQNWKHAVKGRVDDGVVKHVARNVVEEGATREERVLWAQDNLQLNRAWLYGASEIRPETMRETPNAGGMTAVPDESDVNFIEFKSPKESVNTLNRTLNTSRYTTDNYTYALELEEELKVRLHSANLGDRAIESGVEYTEILPVGFTPYAADGSLLGVQAFSGNGVLGADSDDTALSEKITATGTNGVVTVEVVQSPTNDKGLRAPAQNQEADTYSTATTDHGVPYVLKIKVATPLTGMFKNSTSTVESKYQYVDVAVRIDEQAKLKNGNHYYWYDQLTVTSIAAEPYMAIYSKEYGAFDRAEGAYNIGRHENDSIWNGAEISDLRWYYYNSHTTYYSFEPHGLYIRGLNAQGTAINNEVTAETDEMDARPAIVTGDQALMRKPSLRVWNDITKDEYISGYPETAQDFTTELHDRFTIHATAENQQIEAQPAYHSTSSSSINNSGYLSKWENQHQLVGGARGTWFDPTMTVVYPFGIVPVLEDGSSARYDGKVADQQKVAFTAAINDVTHNSRTKVADVTEHLDLRVERIKSDQGERFVLFFTMRDNDAAREALGKIKYGQSLVISPKAMTVDMPPYTDGETLDNQKKFQNILTFANSEVDVFEPIVSSKYQTGTTPLRPSAVDTSRTDTTGSSGRKQISERLISVTGTYLQNAEMDMHTTGSWKVAAESLLPEQVQKSETNYGAFGGTRIAMRYPALVNDTTVDQYADGDFADTELLAPASKFWVSTKVSNTPQTNGTAYNNLLTAGRVHNSRFVVTSYVTSFAEKTGDVKIVVGGKTLDRAQFEALGWAVTAATEDERVEGASDRQVVRWVVTPPAPAEGVAKGRLEARDSFTLLQEYHLVDGFREDTSEGGKWTDENFKIDTYVSLISDDYALAPTGATRDDFVIQPLEPIRYSTLVNESEVGDIDGDDKATGYLAQNATTIEVAKPKGEIRINTTRPRMEYSNGSIGDPYFNTDDTIEYIVTHAKNTGSGLKEMVIDSMLPANETEDSTFNVATREIRTTLEYVTTGQWEIPQAVLDKIASEGKTVDQVFETEVYVSTAMTEDGRADGEWVSIGKSSIDTNTKIAVPADLQNNRTAVRVVLRSIDADFLVPTNARLAVDADESKAGMQDITETDPSNKGATILGKGVTDAAVKIGINAKSDVKQTAFIYNEVELWGNYVADAYVMLDDDQVRSYLTPSRPVVNVFHSALYYRSDSERPSNDPGRYGWSDNITVNPQASQHMKMRGEVINASEDMWSEEESITYAEDRLINPVMTFELPSVMTVDEKRFNYVANADLTAEHPLHDDYRSRFALSPETQAYSWTWKLVGADGGPAREGSFLKHVDIHVGAWDGSDRNLVTVWFEGEVLPGDKIVVDFIGLIDQFVPGTSANDRKSTVYATNNTGLLQPLNSNWNLVQEHPGHKLGYESDRLDFDDNGLLNDRLVFNEQTLFSFEIFDNFGKQKKAYSDLNQAGTVHPAATPVREGGSFSFSLTLDNTREQNDAPYVFPSMYDVLPHVGDSDIQYGPIDPKNLRNSKGSSVVDLGSFKLSREGANGRTYNANEYTVFVGPFSKSGNTVVAHDRFISPADSKSGAFFDSLGTGSTNSSVRDQYFVKLADLKTAVETKPELLDELKTVLVLFNKPGEELLGQHKLRLTYDMVAPINAPALIESRGVEEDFNDYAQWNSFVGTQKKNGFIPQESNRAGAYITERADRVSIGNYVWEDRNYDGAFTGEGETITDVNGRKLLVPGEGQADPGINGVKVTLLTEGGHYADELGNPTKQIGGKWLVVDDATGETFIDEIGQTRESTGPMVTTTRSDVHGRAGYYVFSNIAEGTYRVMFEMPEDYERHWATTDVMTSGAKVNVFGPAVAADVKVANDKALLSMVTDAQMLTTETADEVRMGFDLPVGEWLEFGGVVFNDANRDGLVGSDAKLSGYTVELLDEQGNVVTDLTGVNSVVTKADGKYIFRIVPVPGVFSMRVTYPEGKNFISMPVTPIMHAGHPFAQTDDNDAFAQKVEGGRVIRSNDFRFNQVDLSEYFEKDKQFLGVNFGFYERKTTAVLGDRVWNDLNRNGIQDLGEPGVAGQELLLERFVKNAEDEWVKDETFKRTTTTSGADGYYAFKNVAAYEAKGESDVEYVEYRFQVRVEDGKLAKGFTFTDALVGDDRQVDSDFNRKGTMGNQLISLVEMEEDVRIAVDNTTVDLGLYSTAKGAISGEIFIDAEEDGLKTGDKLADERFTVTLQVSNDGENWSNVAQEQVTGVNQYRFEGLEIFNDADEVNLPNQYRVVVTEIPLWLSITDAHVGKDDSIDSDFVETDRKGTFTAISDTYFLGKTVEDEYFPINTRESVDHEAVDLGLVEPKVIIGGKMWDDANGNGIQDAGEAPIAGEEVVLWEQIGHEWTKFDSSNGFFGWFLNLLGVEQPVTTTTDENGEYRFEVSPLHYEDETAKNFLDARKYKVTVERDAWQSWSPFQQGDDKSIDSDVITPATEFGYELTGVSEIFDVIDEKDGKAVPTSLRDDVEMDLGVTTFDKQITIGGLAWEDVNHDGIQDEGEEPIQGQVALLQEKIDGEWVAVADLEGYETKTTGANGRYSFLVEPAVYDRNASNFLEMREYRVISERLGNQLWSPAGQGEDRTLDSNIHDNAAGVKPQLGGYSDQFTIGEVDAATGWADAASFRDDREIDLGLTTYPATIEIGGRAWGDVNFDGIQQEAEESIEGQVVVLQEKIDGKWVNVEDVNGLGSQPTGADGRYTFVVEPTHYLEEHPLFMQLREYRVISEREGFQAWSPVHVGEDATIDSNVTGNGEKPEHRGYSDLFEIADLAADGRIDVSTVRDDIEMDMGLATYDTSIVIGGRAWDDVNFDGIQQETEESIEGQVVVLQEKIAGEWVNVEDLNGLRSMPTDAEGRYEFVVAPTFYEEDHARYLEVREYRVVSDRLGNQAWSPVHQGEDDTLDSNITGDDTKPEHRGYSDLFVISDALDSGRIDISSVRNDIEMDMGLATYDASIVIGGRAWDDADFDGIQQETEESIVGQVVVLQEKIDGKWVNVEDLNGLGSMPTDEAGRYEFVVAPTFYEEDHERYLEVREYRVISERLGNQAWSPIAQGEDSTLDSNVAGNGEKPEHIGYSELFVIGDALESGRLDISTVRDDIEMDMGLKTHATSIVIGGRAWEDANVDGIQNEDELSVAGQVVTLQEKIDGEWVTIEDLNGVSEMETNEEGRYEFVVAPTYYEEDHELYLQAREYRVTSERLGFQRWSPEHMGEDKTLDSDMLDEQRQRAFSAYFVVADIDDESGRVLIESVRDDLEMDMGLRTYEDRVKIGGTVWVDENSDGAKQYSERRMFGQEITLQEYIDGMWVEVQDVNGDSEMVTDENGYYEFEVLPTRYEEDGSGYLHIRDYRTVMDVPTGHRLSSGAGVTATQTGDTAHSKVSEIAETDAESGLVVLGSYSDDLVLDYPYVVIPLALTGGTLAVWMLPLAGGVMLVGFFLIFLKRRRREEEEGVEARA